MIVTKAVGPLALADQADRPAGLHVSTVISDLMETLYPDVYGGPLSVEKVSTGLAFENVLERAFVRARTGIFRPPPILVDGIWCSPDAVNPDSWAVQEFKLTWYSASKDCPWDKVFWPWIVQIKAYCYALESLLADLWVLFVNGDYKPPKPWPVQVYRLQFTPGERKENWEMLVNHAKSRGML